MKLDQLNPNEYILIKGARTHNLKNISVAIPRHTFTVITGLSGSGKSSLAFDTLYAEGQRRYVESLSSYARQFLSRLEKPEVDYIKGISPTVAIEQKVNTNNPRSTVATSTDIYELLKLLFARLGKIYHPTTDEVVKIDDNQDVLDSLDQFTTNKGIIYLPFVHIKDFTPEDLLAQGFSRAKKENEFIKLENVLENEAFDLVIDRFEIKTTEEFKDQLSDSIELCFNLSEGHCYIDIYTTNKIIPLHFSKDLIRDGIEFFAPDVNLFNFNSPLGACTTCEGYGSTYDITEDKVIPDTNLSIYEDAIAPWKSSGASWWKKEMIKNAHKADLNIHTPYRKLSTAEKTLIWDGCAYFEGIKDFFSSLQRKLYKIQNRILIARYKGRTHCHTCNGSRLKKEALYIKVGGKNIGEVGKMTVVEAFEFIQNLNWTDYELKIAKHIIEELTHRLSILIKVGVPYITLNRGSSTLSGGESQRINLAGTIGNKLTGATYILDEPSIGLHPKDTENLISVLKLLNQNGNTVIVVEHDEHIINNAAYVIDVGPLAGRLGGEIIFQGAQKKLLLEDSLTAKYLNKSLKISREKFKNFVNTYQITLKNSFKNNLDVATISFPLFSFTVICGVSGSGKSTLILDELLPEIQQVINHQKSERLSGDTQHIHQVEYVDQNPIGKSGRSNPVTYVKAFDEIRNLFTSLPLSNINNFQAKHFSLNVSGGRCEKCLGEGYINVEMQFMADIKVLCEECKGKKYKEEVLEVLYEGLSIYDILNLTIDEAIILFSKKINKAVKKRSFEQKIIEKLLPLQKVGLGYVQLGQSSNTLSGGEAQRVKLAYFLSKNSLHKNTLFIFDEPTTGLHFHDVHILLQSFNELLTQNNHLIVIEHNIDVIKNADYVIEIGPEGGDGGGKIIHSGTPDELKSNTKSVTGRYL